MDPQHHSKIADKLMQYRGKIPKHINPSNRIGKNGVFELKLRIDDLLWYIQEYAELESKGLIE
jgi:hypothetical protein